MEINLNISIWALALEKKWNNAELNKTSLSFGEIWTHNLRPGAHN